MPRSPEFAGRRFTIQCLELADGSCPAGDFLDSLSASERRKVDVRIPCIFGRSRAVVLLFALRKKSDKYKRKEIERAEDYRQWYLSQG